MAETVGDFFAEVCSSSPPEFRAEPWYNAAGDCIHYHWQPDEFYAVRIDVVLTVYRSLENDMAVGCQIKGVSALLKVLKCDVHVQLDHTDGTPLFRFLIAGGMSAEASDTDAAKRIREYLYVIEQVGSKQVTLPLEHA